MEQIDDELLGNSSGKTSESETIMSPAEPRALPCWASPSRSCWLWPLPSAAHTAGATRTCCCRPSTPPGDSWPAWRWMWATPRDPRRSPKPLRSATWAWRGSPANSWRAGTVTSASSATCSCTPPTTTARRSSPPPSTGRSRRSTSSTWASRAASRSSDCAWDAVCLGTGDSDGAGQRARRRATRCTSAAWISLWTSWRATGAGGSTASPSSPLWWRASWL